MFKILFLLSRALKEVFKNLFMRGFSHYDRQLRNDILVITTIIAQNPAAPMIVSISYNAICSNGIHFSCRSSASLERE